MLLAWSAVFGLCRDKGAGGTQSSLLLKMCSIHVVAVSFTVGTVWESHPKSILSWSQQDMQSEIFILFDFFFSFIRFIAPVYGHHYFSQNSTSTVSGVTLLYRSLQKHFQHQASLSLASTLPFAPFLWKSWCSWESQAAAVQPVPSQPLAWELFLLHTLVWETLLSSLFLHRSVPSPFPWMPLELMHLQLLGFGAKSKLYECFASFRTMAKLNGYLGQYTKRPKQTKQLSTLLRVVATPGSLKQNWAFDIYCC